MLTINNKQQAIGSMSHRPNYQEKNNKGKQQLKDPDTFISSALTAR